MLLFLDGKNMELLRLLQEKKPKNAECSKYADNKAFKIVGCQHFNEIM